MLNITLINIKTIVNPPIIAKSWLFCFVVSFISNSLFRL